MQKYHIFWIPLFLFSCSTFSDKSLKDSLLEQYYRPPAISINPDPNTDIINTFDFRPFIDISQVGGLSKITLSIDGATQEFDASGATNFQLRPPFKVSSSCSIPVTISALALKTGNISTTNFRYLFDVSGVGDPPAFILESPPTTRDQALGNILVKGLVIQGAAKIKSVRISSVGYPDQENIFTEPYPANYSVSAPYTKTSPGVFSITLNAVSGENISLTTNLSWNFVDRPTIEVVTPVPAGTTINTLSTNFSITVKSPKTASVTVSWDGVSLPSQTTDGLSTPISFSVPIPQRPSSAPTGTGVLSIQASYAGGTVVSTNITYNIDHSAILNPPTITSISPNTASLFMPMEKITFSASAEQAFSGIKSLKIEQISPNSSTNVTLPASPFTPNLSLSKEFGRGEYAGTYNFRVTAVSHANVTNISNISYLLESSLPMINYVRDTISNGVYNFQASDPRPGSTISRIVISTNRIGTETMTPAYTFAPNTLDFNTDLTLSKPNNKKMKIQMAVVSSEGIISTNLYTITTPPQNPYIIYQTITNNDRLPSGSFPFKVTVVDADPITSVEARLNGIPFILNSGVSSLSSYTFSANITSLPGFPNEFSLSVNGKAVENTPFTINIDVGLKSVRVSFPQKESVFTTDVIRFQIENWPNSLNLPAGRSTITKLSGSGGTEVKYITSAINAGTLWTQPSADAFDLDYGINRFRFDLEPSAGASAYSEEIIIYRHDNKTY